MQDQEKFGFKDRRGGSLGFSKMQDQEKFGFKDRRGGTLGFSNMYDQEKFGFKDRRGRSLGFSKMHDQEKFGFKDRRGGSLGICPIYALVLCGVVWCGVVGWCWWSGCPRQPKATMAYFSWCGVVLCGGGEVGVLGSHRFFLEIERERENEMGKQRWGDRDGEIGCPIYIPWGSYIFPLGTLYISPGDPIHMPWGPYIYPLGTLYI